MLIYKNMNNPEPKNKSIYSFVLEHTVDGKYDGEDLPDNAKISEKLKLDGILLAPGQARCHRVLIFPISLHYPANLHRHIYRQPCAQGQNCKYFYFLVLGYSCFYKLAYLFVFRDCL